MSKTLKYKTIINAEAGRNETIAKIVIETDGTYYQGELTNAIRKIMSKLYMNVFVEDKK